jgi:hypothetical protein
VAKQDAAKAWRKLKPDSLLRVRILSRLGQHKASAQWQRNSGEFIPHPATWLNGRRFDDELPDAELPRAFPTQHIPQASDDGWFEDCQRLHGGACGGRVKHALRVDIDAGRTA